MVGVRESHDIMSARNMHPYPHEIFPSQKNTALSSPFLPLFIRSPRGAPQVLNIHT